MTARGLEPILRSSFIAIGLLLSVYIGFATLGYINSSATHYSNYVLAIIVLSTLLGAMELTGEWRERGADLKRMFFLRAGVLIFGALLAIYGAGYIRFSVEHLELVQPFFDPPDLYAGMMLLTGVLLLNLFHWGWLLTSLVVLSVIYFFFGYKIPFPLLALPEYDTGFVMNYLGLSMADGMFWFARVAADSIYFLIIYASTLLGIGMLKLVSEIGKSAGRHVRGGAALPAILGSGIIASVMGQAVANVMLTGRLTIPMMIRHGYKPKSAGAIEAVASSSGQIMPPVLGLAAFIIAVFLGRPYLEIALAGLIPAVLFLTGTVISVLNGAYRDNLPKLDEPYEGEAIIRLAPAFIISFSVVAFLLVGYYSPSYAGLFGILTALVLSAFQGKHRPTFAELMEALYDGLRLITLLSILLIAVGPLAQTFQTTNLAQRLGSFLLQVIPSNTGLVLLGSMVVSLILGMGLPTPVAYLVVALSLVPFIIMSGVEPIAAHFFVFYFAVFSTLTPPVAVSVLAAAKISGARFISTAFEAMRLMLPAFIVPFAFCYHPQMLDPKNFGWDTLSAIVLVLILQFAISALSHGYFFKPIGHAGKAMAAATSLVGIWALVSFSG